MMKNKKVSTGIWMFIILGIFICVGIYSLIAWNSYNSQFYSAEDIASVCDSLNLSVETEFCKSDKNNFQTLETSLVIQYPLYDTNYSDLVSNIDSPLIVHTCNEVNPLTANSCPEPNQCQGNYTCYIPLPDAIGRLRIDFNDEGLVTRYFVSRPDSAP